jgi:hypothetical protein
MAHEIGWSCFPKINGAELESLGAVNMEVLLAKNKKKLGKDMGCANFLLPSFTFLLFLFFVCDSAPCLYSFFITR